MRGVKATSAFVVLPLVLVLSAYVHEYITDRGEVKKDNSNVKTLSKDAILHEYDKHEAGSNNMTLSEEATHEEKGSDETGNVLTLANKDTFVSDGKGNPQLPKTVEECLGRARGKAMASAGKAEKAARMEVNQRYREVKQANAKVNARTILLVDEKVKLFWGVWSSYKATLFEPSTRMTAGQLFGGERKLFQSYVALQDATYAIQQQGTRNDVRKNVLQLAARRGNAIYDQMARRCKAGVLDKRGIYGNKFTTQNRSMFEGELLFSGLGGIGIGEYDTGSDPDPNPDWKAYADDANVTHILARKKCYDILHEIKSDVAKGSTDDEEDDTFVSSGTPQLPKTVEACLERARGKVTSSAGNAGKAAERKLNKAKVELNKASNAKSEAGKTISLVEERVKLFWGEWSSYKATLFEPNKPMTAAQLFGGETKLLQSYVALQAATYAIQQQGAQNDVRKNVLHLAARKGNAIYPQMARRCRAGVLDESGKYGKKSTDKSRTMFEGELLFNGLGGSDDDDAGSDPDPNPDWNEYADDADETDTLARKKCYDILHKIKNDVANGSTDDEDNDTDDGSTDEFDNY